jgi:hypothetical protein
MERERGGRATGPARRGTHATGSGDSPVSWDSTTGPETRPRPRQSAPGVPRPREHDFNDQGASRLHAGPGHRRRRRSPRATGPDSYPSDQEIPSGPHARFPRASPHAGLGHPLIVFAMSPPRGAKLHTSSNPLVVVLAYEHLYSRRGSSILPGDSNDRDSFPSLPLCPHWRRPDDSGRVANPRTCAAGRRGQIAAPKCDPGSLAPWDLSAWESAADERGEARYGTSTGAR